MPKTDRYQDRAKASDAARKAAQARFAALAPKQDDPAVIERLKERIAVAAAREGRNAKRDADRQALAEAQAAETALRAAAAAAAQGQAEEEERQRIATANAAKTQAIELLKQQKRARDARYAARQARRK